MKTGLGTLAFRCHPDPAVFHEFNDGDCTLDIKTDNVLVAHDGRVVITDFGIARTIETGDGDESAQLSGLGMLTGTPAYMAPEQVRGHGRVDGRADLYALGVMRFHMLTGQLPFAGASALEAALARLYEGQDRTF